MARRGKQSHHIGGHFEGEALYVTYNDEGPLYRWLPGNERADLRDENQREFTVLSRGEFNRHKDKFMLPDGKPNREAVPIPGLKNGRYDAVWLRSKTRPEAPHLKEVSPDTKLEDLPRGKDGKIHLTMSQDPTGKGGHKLTIDPTGDLANWNVQRRAVGLPEHDPRKTTTQGAQFAREAFEEILAWGRAQGAFMLQKNECSRLHKIVDCFEGGTSVKIANDEDRTETKSSYDLRDLQTFVVKHDWRAAFGESLGTVTEGEMVLPFAACAFEFKVNGRVVVFIFRDNEDGARTQDLFLEASNGIWAVYNEKEDGPTSLWAFLISQVQAICVMLDSEVATTDIIRQPPKLNKKREQAGKTPLADYHVVDLSVRHRKKSSGPVEPTGRHMRAHWRRGHWVHSDEQPRIDLHRPDVAKRWQQHDGRWRTWKKWQVVGDPDLGFVEHEYKL